MGMATIVKVDKVVKRYRFTTALEGVSLEINAGEKILLKGPNGSGKTTLLKIIAGLVRPSKGSVEVFGYDPVKHVDVVSKHISYYFEDDPLPWWLDGHSYLEFLADIQSFLLSEIKDLIKLMGVEEFWDRKIYTYSSGMKRKIQVIRGFLGRKELVILDEPLTFIDPESRRRLAEFIRDYNDGCVIVASHIDEGLSNAVNRVVYMDGGKINKIESSIRDRENAGKME